MIIFCLIFPQILHADKAYFDLSDNEIEIQTNFNGKEVIIFGLTDPKFETILVIKGPSKNIKVQKKNNPGIVDFQDAVEGPITYDIVSLLRDCYISWPETRVLEWCEDYYFSLDHSIKKIMNLKLANQLLLKKVKILLI